MEDCPTALSVACVKFLDLADTLQEVGSVGPIDCIALANDVIASRYRQESSLECHFSKGMTLESGGQL